MLAWRNSFLNFIVDDNEYIGPGFTAFKIYTDDGFSWLRKTALALRKGPVLNVFYSPHIIWVHTSCHMGHNFKPSAWRSNSRVGFIEFYWRKESGPCVKVKQPFSRRSEWCAKSDCVEQPECDRFRIHTRMIPITCSPNSSGKSVRLSDLRSDCYTLIIKYECLMHHAVPPSWETSLWWRWALQYTSSGILSTATIRSCS